VSPPRTVAEAKVLLESAGLRASRRRGQNFLFDPKLLDRIVDLADVSASDVVLEVGTGLGSLTDRIAARAGRVVTVEIDRGIAALARELLADRSNVVVLEQDALAGDRVDARPQLAPEVDDALRSALATSGGRFLVISNLPYSSASPLLLAFLDRDDPPVRAVVLVQKEVADRVVAAPGTREYGMLGACVRWFASARRAGDIGPGAFWPPPKVRSSLLVLEPGRGVGSGRNGYAAFRDVAGALFSGRRKRASSALARRFGDAAAAERALVRAGLPAAVRADALGPEAIRAVADVAAAEAPPDRSSSDRRRGAS
jgi:16S rRNA (adenine1518-N6/adenine1519-N6)-dimethyltransferase